MEWGGWPEATAYAAAKLAGCDGHPWQGRGWCSLGYSDQWYIPFLASTRRKIACCGGGGGGTACG
jgi:hypothetical protein